MLYDHDSRRQLAREHHARLADDARRTRADAQDLPLDERVVRIRLFEAHRAWAMRTPFHPRPMRSHRPTRPGLEL